MITVELKIITLGRYTDYVEMFKVFAQPYFDNGFEVARVSERKKYFLFGPNVVSLKLSKITLNK